MKIERPQRGQIVYSVYERCKYAGKIFRIVEAGPDVSEDEPAPEQAGYYFEQLYVWNGTAWESSNGDNLPLSGDYFSHFEDIDISEAAPCEAD